MTAPAPGRLLALAFLIFAVSACTCAGIESIGHAFRTKPFVFTARVIGRAVPRRVTGLMGLDLVGWVTLPVQSWKGSLPDTVVVYSTMGGGDCGYRFVPGNDYIICANLESLRGWPQGTADKATMFAGATTYICDATTRVLDVRSVFTELGEPVWVRDDPDEG